jgi:hypothetical protein
MTKVNRIKRGNFVTISNIPFKDREISLKAKGLLGVIMSLPDNWNFTITGIATCLKESTGAISAAINELMKAGYCVRKIVYDDSHKIQGYSYTFSDEKELLLDEPSEEKPLKENPSTEIPLSENRAQINNNIKKIKNKDKEKDAEASKKPLSYSSEEEQKFYEGMESAYPFVAKMQFPLLYQDYVKLLSKYSAKKIHANLKKMNNWKELNKKRRFAKDVLEDWLADDKKEY